VARYRFQEELALAGGANVIMSNPSRTLLGDAVGARLIPTTLGGGNLEGGADFFFDCVGSKSSLQEGLLTLRARGTHVLVATAGVLGPVDFSSLWFRELKLTGSAMFAHGIFQGQKIRTYEKAVEILARGDYPLQGLVSHLFRLADYRRAFQVAFDKRHHRSLKVALDLRD
jgi:threonine dehydrogenase-like Zn-dependent dehydrogenase